MVPHDDDEAESELANQAWNLQACAEDNKHNWQKAAQQDQLWSNHEIVASHGDRQDPVCALASVYQRESARLPHRSYQLLYATYEEHVPAYWEPRLVE